MRKILFGLFIGGIIACTPKATVPSETIEQVEEVQEVVEKSTPCTILNELAPAVKDETETAFVLYKDFLKAGNYDEAFAYWKTAYYNAPGSNGSIQYHYDDGVKLYRNKYENSDDISLKRSYADSVRAIYNKRKECFGDAVYLDGRLGFDLYYYFYEATTEDEVFNLFTSVLESKGEDSDYFIMNPFAKILYDKAVDGSLPPAEAGKYAKIVLAAVKKGLNNCVKDCESWNIINDYAPARLENLEGIKGLYDCDYYSNKYYTAFKADPTNCEVINEAYRRMKWGECPESNTLFQEVAQAKRTHCTVVVNTEPGPLRQAYDAYEAGDYSGAVKKFEDFANGTTDVDKKAKYLLLVAKIYYRDIKKYAKARTYAEKAAEVKPSWGEPYLLIGKLYASSGPICGPGRGWDSQIVTWPAIDAFQKAKSIDPSVSTEANKWINTYKQYMPSKEDIFQRRLNVGDNFKVGCWINRSTTVRTAD